MKRNSQEGIPMEQIKQNYKIVSLVDSRTPWDNKGCPLYHTRLVKAEEAHEALLADFKSEMGAVGADGEGCGYTIEVDGEEVDWGYDIPKMTLAEVVERAGHTPTIYTIVDAEQERIIHTLTAIT